MYIPSITEEQLAIVSRFSGDDNICLMLPKEGDAPNIAAVLTKSNTDVDGLIALGFAYDVTATIKNLPVMDRPYKIIRLNEHIRQMFASCDYCENCYKDNKPN